MSHFGWKQLLAICVGASLAGACGSARSANQEAVTAELERTMRDAYDLSKPNVLERMLQLYSGSGRIVSASGGSIIASRDSLESGIRYFWNNVGVNMHEPRWIWGRFYVDVLSPSSAVVTATYTIPHRNPRGEPHTLGGAMTAVFVKRDDRWVIIHEHLSDLPQEQDSTARHDHE